MGHYYSIHSSASFVHLSCLPCTKFPSLDQQLSQTAAAAAVVVVAVVLVVGSHFVVNVAVSLVQRPEHHFLSKLR